MRKVVTNLMMVLALLLGLSPALAPGAAVAAASEPPSPSAMPPGPLAPGNRGVPSDLQMVPDDVQALFEKGMTADEFVQMAGYVPRALEGMVSGNALMIVELDGDPLSVYYATQQSAGQAPTRAGLQSYRSSLQAAQAALAPQLTKLGAQIISNYTAAYNGIQVLVPLKSLNQIRALPGVKAIHRAPIHQPELATSVPLIGAPEVWNDLGYDGTGVTIAVIDTGIDYTHKVFGGPGTPMAYSLNNPNVIESGTFPTAKVVGGYDFAGTNYDASATDGSEIPVPDPDPLDEYGHGTHVSSIAAGIAAGEVMTGVAPGASLIALKVFGAEGSTSLTVDALDWATLQYSIRGRRR